MTTIIGTNIEDAPGVIPIRIPEEWEDVHFQVLGWVQTSPNHGSLSGQYLIDEAVRAHPKNRTIGNVIISILEGLVRQRSLRKELKRLRVFLTQAFGNRETVDVEARTTVGCLYLAVEHLHKRRGLHERRFGGSFQVNRTDIFAYAPMKTANCTPSFFHAVSFQPIDKLRSRYTCILHGPLRALPYGFRPVSQYMNGDKIISVADISLALRVRFAINSCHRCLVRARLLAISTPCLQAHLYITVI